MMEKTTLIIGASTNPERYSYKAAERLISHGHAIKMIGRREGVLFENKIYDSLEQFDDIDTVTLYVGPQHQPAYYDYIVSLDPRRVIFNPGTENPDFYDILKKADITCEVACTLVLLSTDQY